MACHQCEFRKAGVDLKVSWVHVDTNPTFNGKGNDPLIFIPQLPYLPFLIRKAIKLTTPGSLIMRVDKEGAITQVKYHQHNLSSTDKFTVYLTNTGERFLLIQL